MSWKIENLLRGSYEDWIEYFKSQLKLDLSGITKHNEHLVENFQRRNLFVHNDGVVNKIYLSKVPKSLTKPEMLNSKLIVSKDYLFNSIDRFETSFLQLAFELWAKCEKASEKRPSLIVHSSYDALQNKRWRVAAELADFISKDKAANEGDILMAQVNAWIARKKFDDKEKIQQEIGNFDVSAKDDIFKLAKYCLLEETEDALSLAKKLEKAKRISLNELSEWPLFSDLRSTPKMESWLKQLRAKIENRKPKATDEGRVNSTVKSKKQVPEITSGKAVTPRRVKKSAS